MREFVLDLVPIYGTLRRHDHLDGCYADTDVQCMSHCLALAYRSDQPTSLCVIVITPLLIRDCWSVTVLVVVVVVVVDK